MCYNLQTQVKVIAIIYLVFAGLGCVRLILSIDYTIEYSRKNELSLMFGGSPALALGIEIYIYGIWAVSGTLCLVGAIKNNKCLLIPFMISLCLTILAYIGFRIFLVYVGFTDVLYATELRFRPNTISLFIGLGLSIYCLVITKKFYNELSSGFVSGWQKGMVLKAYTLPPGVLADRGVPIVYLNGGEVPKGNDSLQPQPAIPNFASNHDS